MAAYSYDDWRLDGMYAGMSSIVKAHAMGPRYAPHPVPQDEIDAEVADWMAYNLYSFVGIRPREKADRMVSEYMKRRGRVMASSTRFDDESQAAGS